METLKYCIGFLILLFPLLGMTQTNDWQLKKEEGGIKVYTKQIEGASLDAFKGVGKVEASMQQIMEVLRDGGNYEEWYPNCSEAVQKENTPARQVNYSVTDAPFPVSDRDSYVEVTFDTLENGMRVNLRALPNYGPEVEDRVRIHLTNGFWYLEKLDDNSTMVTYQMQADPGGSIPSWLANATAVDMPLETLENLREMVE
jgi:hypothetical protein